jgi:formate dehydrogenase major subunit
MPAVGRVKRALARLDHLVVQDIFPTDTAEFADVILPAAALLEKEGTLTNIDRRVQLTRAALDPPGEARPDWWIIREMARRCGLDWAYAGPAEVFDEMRRAMPNIGGITWERLEREGAVQYPCRAEGDPETPFLFTERFNTPSGRARLVPAAGWEPADLTGPDFPLVMTTGRTLEHHTGPMSRRATILDRLDPVAFAAMNPEDMDRLGLTPGRPARIRSREGEIVTPIRPDSSLPPGLVFAPYCYSEAPANALVGPAMDPHSKTAEMKYTAVSVTAVPGETSRGCHTSDH